MQGIHEQIRRCGELRDLPVRTLASVCEEYVRGDIHFLKVDVEGFEGEVLAHVAGRFGIGEKRGDDGFAVLERAFGGGAGAGAGTDVPGFGKGHYGKAETRES